MSVLAIYIYILGYLLGYLLSRASLSVLLFLFLRVLLLYFLPLLGLFRALKYFIPYSVNYATAWVPFTLVSLYIFNFYTPL